MNRIPKAYGKLFLNGIKHPYLYLWDAWSFNENETLHLYCLAVPRFLSDGSELDLYERNNYPFHIRHFSSKDNGNSWKDEGCFLSADEVSKLNFKTIWSGSVMRLSDGRKLVAFTGIENIDSSRNYHQSVALAVSNDGYSVIDNSKKNLSSPSKDWDEIVDKGYYLDKIDNLGSDFGEENGPIMSWRDPFMFFDKKGELNLFWGAKTNPRTGALARVTLEENDGIFKIKKLYPPILVPDADDFTQLEVPKILYDKNKDLYYLIISSCNRLYESQPASEVSKEVRAYKSQNVEGPWVSLGSKILKSENLFGLTVLKEDFKNNRLLCIAPYTENADPDLRLTFPETFYMYLDPLRVEFSKKTD